ncbi:TPA: SlyX family protein [Proteus mirabilis]|uniref:SlyX family protein n=1 Tax=Proteus mirabilis TaxID=584 RepID=UPI0009C57373|nr:SlyX family protein [Proteus mirabilis]AZH00103.1 SlyX family protein [Proteus mirabilis]MCI9768974.1 SlyX family protein [Proteus mirabilis]MCI9772565.1 SlyX family protein [Proteus mirabilis]MCI9776156.1 SlyX family protein [Proteus mirabilis]MDM3594979.1 SlyX family protein [Proteus mirabilis]
MDIKEIEELLIQLESKIAFQDATIEELNQVVTQQQIEIGRFKEALKIVTERLKSSQSSMLARPEDETPPPHY